MAENFLSFRAKKCLGMVLDFEYQVARVYANHNKAQQKRDEKLEKHDKSSKCKRNVFIDLGT